MEEEMYLLIAKALNREATPAEQQRLDAWLLASEDNRHLFREVELLWTDADEIFAQPQFDSHAAWNKVFAATIGATEKTVPNKKVISFRKWIGAGIAVAALLAVLLLINVYTGVEIITESAEDSMLAIELPDHTKVRLEAGSTISYPEKFSGNERKVTLTGKAFFEVTRNERQPFSIDANSIQVEVLGTSFYVTTGKDMAAVAVTQGKVRMLLKEGKSNGHQLVLTPGQKGIYKYNQLNSVADTNANYYKTGLLHLTDITLARALVVLSEIQNAKVIPDATLAPARKEQKINISFKDQPVEKMLDELCLITGTRWKKNNDQYVIYDN